MPNSITIQSSLIFSSHLIIENSLQIILSFCNLPYLQYSLLIIFTSETI